MSAEAEIEVSKFVAQQIMPAEAVKTWSEFYRMGINRTVRWQRIQPWSMLQDTMIFSDFIHGNVYEPLPRGLSKTKLYLRTRILEKVAF